MNKGQKQFNKTSEFPNKDRIQKAIHIQRPQSQYLNTTALMDIQQQINNVNDLLVVMQFDTQDTKQQNTTILDAEIDQKQDRHEQKIGVSKVDKQMSSTAPPNQAF